MDPGAVAALLDALAARTAGQAVLWRGPSLAGRDVDIVVTAGAAEATSQTLLAAGLDPRPGDPGHVVWLDRTGALPEIDVLAASAWPAAYPALDGVVARAEAVDGVPLPVAAPEDRALVFAAEAVAGRPLERSAGRARDLLADPAVARRARRLADQEGATALLDLVAGDVAALARRGRLPYGRALAVARRSPRARAALRARVEGRVGRPLPGAGRGAPRPLLVAVSGMDGAGKSTLAEAVRAHLEARGRPAAYAWARLGAEADLLDRIATPVKRLLRRKATVGNPVAAGGPAVTKVQDPREAAGRRQLVSWVWIVLVAVLNARTYRQAARRRGAGVSLVCDRWLTDALVDLELRYGRHRAAAWALRRLVPRPDVGVLLVLDAATAARRKPGDQALWALERAERLYAAAAREAGLREIPATLPREVVRERLIALVDEQLAAAPR